MDFKQTCEKGEAVSVWQYSFVGTIFSKVIVFYGKKQPAKVKVVYLQ